MRKTIFLFLLVFVLFSIAFAVAEDVVSDSSSDDSSGSVATESGASNIQESSEIENVGEKVSEEKVELQAEPGMTPDNPIYFVKDAYQRITVGDDPEKALDYKEQKIAEAQVMVEEGKPEQAEKVLDRALQYSDIIEKEASPEMKSRVQESSAAVENTIRDMEEKTIGSEWTNVNEKFVETIQKEKEIGTAAELAAKINELCASLAQLDPLQYADACKSKENSPRWMREQDKEISAEQEEQAKVFFEKLSQCFESPENCDCKGMGVQKFEDFCLEKSKLSAECNKGDENACKEVQSGADPSDLLPDYLVPVLNQVQGKYMSAQFEMYVPEECVKEGAKTAEDCSKIMFKLNAPQECVDAGLTGKTKEDEIKCEKIMFEKNAPQECTDAGISSSDSDAPRKCAKIMFVQRAPQECTDAGITGEGRDDEKKCKQMMQQGTSGQNGNYAQKFNRDCNKIQDSNEKIKCYEEFYNNAQVQFSENFVQKEMTDSRTGEVITSGEEGARQQCKSKGMDTILEYENGKRIIICVDKNNPSSQGGQTCQSQQQIENLKQDCQKRGQGANVENRNGCPWVICMGGEAVRTYATETQNQYQQSKNRIDKSSGVKCPDGNCDDYERMNPWACPEDCGGTRQPGDYQPPQNRIDSQEPSQNQEGFCSGSAPSCAPNGAPYCQNENWICPSAPPQEQQPQEPSQPPQDIQTPQTSPPQQETQQPSTETDSGGESAPSGDSGGEPAPTTGSVITGRIIVSDFGEENTRSGDAFLDYWFER